MTIHAIADRGDEVVTLCGHSADGDGGLFEDNPPLAYVTCSACLLERDGPLVDFPH